MNRLYLLLSLPAGLLGLGITLAAASIDRSARRRRESCTARTQARVAGLAAVHGRNRYYVYEYTVDGALWRADYIGRRHAGDTVEIHYNPRQPGEICIPRYQSRGMVVALYFIGGVWLLMGLVMPVLGLMGAA